VSKANDFSKIHTEKEKFLEINKCERVLIGFGKLLSGNLSLKLLSVQRAENDGNIIACRYKKGHGKSLLYQPVNRQ
jgi:hypothetical protein